MSVDMAEATLQVKDLMVQAEDARLIRNHTGVKKHMDMLHDVNMQLLGTVIIVLVIITVDILTHFMFMNCTTDMSLASFFFAFLTRTLPPPRRPLAEDYKRRSQNHEALLQCLKQVHDAIQQASRLRTGSAKASVVTQCRQAVKVNDAAMLIKAMRLGQLAEQPQQQQQQQRSK